MKQTEDTFRVGQRVVVADKGNHRNGQVGEIYKTHTVPVDRLKRVEEYYVVFSTPGNTAWLRANQLRLESTVATFRDRLAIMVEECRGFRGISGVLEYPCGVSKNRADEIIKFFRENGWTEHERK